MSRVPGYPTSLSTDAARNLATTTKSKPVMQGITSRWLLRGLAWLDVKGGVYRINRRRRYLVGDGKIEFANVGDTITIPPEQLRELNFLRTYDDLPVLAALAASYTRRDLAPGDVIVEQGAPANRGCLVARGRVERVGRDKYGDEVVLEVLTSGDHFSPPRTVDPDVVWPYTARAVTRCTVFTLERSELEAFVEAHPTLKVHYAAHLERLARPVDDEGEAAIEVAAGHEGEPVLPTTFVDYDPEPREYELSVAQAIVRVHTRVADLYNEPMNQLEEQIRLTIEALRERQEHELINDPHIGLLHNADMKHRINSATGAPTPDDFDRLLAVVWNEPSFFLAHPHAIAAFGRECSKRGIYPERVAFAGAQVPAWRGVPVLPCNKLPISPERTTSVLLLRTGAHNQGVVGLHQTGLPDEREPSLSVRFMGITEQSIIQYLVSCYYSVAVAVPDELAILDDVQVDRFASSPVG